MAALEYTELCHEYREARVSAVFVLRGQVDRGSNTEAGSCGRREAVVIELKTQRRSDKTYDCFSKTTRCPSRLLTHLLTSPPEPYFQLSSSPSSSMAETTEAAAALLPVASTSTLPQTSNGNTTSASRRTHVQQGDWVMLQLPSKNIKVFKLSENTSIINLGKYGTFDAKSQLIGRHYGATLEVVPPASTSASPAPPSTSVNSEEHGEQSTANTHKPEGGAEAEAGKNNGKKKGRKDRDRDAPQTLCSLRPYEEMTLEEIEVTEATNQNILATGAKVSLCKRSLDMYSLL